MESKVETGPAGVVAPPLAAPAVPDATPEQAAQKAREAIESIRSLIDTFVPPEVVILTDTFGGKHQLGGYLPARSQIRVMRRLEALSALEAGDELRAAMTGASGLQAGILALVRAAGNEEVLRGVAEAFEAAHPALVADVRQTAKAQGFPFSDAADLFGIEEIAAGLVPFFLALLRRLVGLLGDLIQPAPTDN